MLFAICRFVLHGKFRKPEQPEFQVSEQDTSELGSSLLPDIERTRPGVHGQKRVEFEEHKVEVFTPGFDARDQQQTFAQDSSRSTSTHHLGDTSRDNVLYLICSSDESSTRRLFRSTKLSKICGKKYGSLSEGVLNVIGANFPMSFPGGRYLGKRSLKLRVDEIHFDVKLDCLVIVFLHIDADYVLNFIKWGGWENIGHQEWQEIMGDSILDQKGNKGKSPKQPKRSRKGRSKK